MQTALYTMQITTPLDTPSKKTQAYNKKKKLYTHQSSMVVLYSLKEEDSLKITHFIASQQMQLPIKTPRELNRLYLRDTVSLTTLNNSWISSVQYCTCTSVFVMFISLTKYRVLMNQETKLVAASRWKIWTLMVRRGEVLTKPPI